MSNPCAPHIEHILEDDDWPVNVYFLTSYIICYTASDTESVIVWRESLAPVKFGEIEDQPKFRQTFTIQIFTQV